MDDHIRNALYSDRTIDISTTGARTGKTHRIEIWFHRIDDRFFITGMPRGPRDWYANLIANPGFTFHLKGSAKADLGATARPIRDTDERTAILGPITTRLKSVDPVEKWVGESPLVEVTF